MQIAVLGIDLGKNSCSVVGLNDTGAVVVRRRMKRDRVIAFATKLPVCIGEAIGAEDNSEVIACLDRVESFLQQKGLLNADLRCEIEGLRSAPRQ